MPSKYGLTNLRVGEMKTVIVNGKNGRRKVTFQRVKTTGNLQYRIVMNTAA